MIVIIFCRNRQRKRDSANGTLKDDVMKVEETFFQL